MRVHVLEANRNVGLPHAYEYFLTHRHWFPIIASRGHLRDLGITVKFFADVTAEIYDCDTILLSSRRFNEVFGTKFDPKARAEAIEKFRRPNVRIVWCDVRDSSGTTQFEVIPYVDAYAKGILHKDRSIYEYSLAGGRVFTDYLEKRHGISNELVAGMPVNDQQDNFTPLRPEWTEKLLVSWDTSYDFRTIAGARYGRLLRAAKVPLMFGRQAPQADWGDPLGPRNLDVIVAFGMGQYPRETLIYQRKEALRRVGALNSPKNRVGKVPPKEYTASLKTAKIIISCFGHGEICSREHEAWIGGSAVVMPDMSMFEVYPNRYVAGTTYEPVEWSMSDLEGAIAKLLSDEKYRQHLAVNGQNEIRRMFSRDGMEAFAKRFQRIVNIQRP